MIITPETPEEIHWVRHRADQSLGTLSPMDNVITGACRAWVEANPSLADLKAGSVVGVPSGLLYIVQSDEQWLQLDRNGEHIEGRMINPKGAEWSDTTIIWSAS